MSRHSLTDAEWNAIRVFLPAERPTRAGRPWAPHRQVINGILWVLCTGGSWKDVPPEFGNRKTIYNRFLRWTKERLWERIADKLLNRLDAAGKVNRSLWCVDGSVVRAHRVASGAPKGQLNTDENAAKHALGRSRGGYSTKIHVVTDVNGVPIAVTATPGQINEATEFEHLLNSIPLSLHRKHKRPKALAGDKAYSSGKIRSALNRQSISDVIPTRSNERPRRFAKMLYRKRNIVERVIGRLKEHRRIATRYDKLVDTYLAMIRIAFIRMLIKRN